MWERTILQMTRTGSRVGREGEGPRSFTLRGSGLEPGWKGQGKQIGPYSSFRESGRVRGRHSTREATIPPSDLAACEMVGLLWSKSPQINTVVYQARVLALTGGSLLWLPTRCPWRCEEMPRASAFFLAADFIQSSIWPARQHAPRLLRS